LKIISLRLLPYRFTQDCFWATICEPTALELAKANFNVIVKQANAGTRISDSAQIEIQNIIDEILAANIRPNKNDEIERIRKVCLSGKIHRVKLTKIDVFLGKANGEKFLFDIKTAKSNKGGFKEFKRTLFAILAENPKAKVSTLI
jgi:type II restriction enzyme